MAAGPSASDWPPRDGRSFIESPSFGNLLVKITNELASTYPQMDFTDAIAHVFTWFDRKLKSNRRFVNARRFRTHGAFVAYVRQALWNAGRMAERQRQRFEPIEALPANRPITTWGTNPEDLVVLMEAVESLPEPQKTVFQRLFIEEEAETVVAQALGCSQRRICMLYEEAVDMIGRRLRS